MKAGDEILSVDTSIICDEGCWTSSDIVDYIRKQCLLEKQRLIQEDPPKFLPAPSVTVVFGVKENEQVIPDENANNMVVSDFFFCLKTLIFLAFSVKKVCCKLCC